MRSLGRARPHKRSGIYYLVRRGPKEFAPFDTRRLVRISTGIRVADDPRAIRAAGVVEKLSAELDLYWQSLRDGRSDDGRHNFEAAQKRARALGLPYRTAEEISQGP